MKDLITALQILSDYRSGDDNPTCCEHDVLYVTDVTVSPDKMAKVDVATLDRLGFHWDDDHGCWASFRFGSS